MKKLIVGLFIAATLLVMLGTQVSAQGPTGEWTTTIYCVNQDDANDAQIDVIFYDQAGDQKQMISDTIPAGLSKYYYPADLTLTNFAGSVMINSSAAIACSTHTQNKADGTKAKPYMLGASGGFNIATASPTMYVSQLLKNFSSGAFGFYESYIAIQNTDVSGAVTVRVEYTDRFRGLIASATREYDIPASSSKIVYLYENDNLPVGFLGSAKVTDVDGTTPLAVQAVFYNNGTDYTKSQFHVYNGTPAGENKLYAPFIMRNFYDFNGGFNIVNVGDQPTSFKIEFTIGRSTTNKYTYIHPTELEPGQLHAFFMPDIAAVSAMDGLPMRERAGSAVITATSTTGAFNSAGRLVANMNFRNDGRDPSSPNFGGHAVTYNAVGADFASQVLYVPNVQSKVSGAEFTSGINVANIENTAGSCTYTFIGQPGLTWIRPIPANGIYSVLVSDITGLKAGYNDAVRIDCDVNVIAIITMRANANNIWGDSQTGINALKP